MTKSKIIFGVFIISVGICGFLFLFKDKEPLFSLNESAVSKIMIQNGSTGEVSTFSSEEDLAFLIKQINGFRYKKTEILEPADGWTIHIKIYKKTNEVTSFYISNNTDVEIDHIKYISAQPNYFLPLIEMLQ